MTVIHLMNQNKVLDCTIVKFYIKALNDCLASIEDVIFGLTVSFRVHASLRQVQTCQLQKQTDPAKTNLVRCLVSKSHGSEVCNCRVQRVFLLSLSLAHNCSFTTKKNPLAPRVLSTLKFTQIQKNASRSIDMQEEKTLTNDKTILILSLQYVALC